MVQATEKVGVYKEFGELVSTHRLAKLVLLVLDFI